MTTEKTHFTPGPWVHYDDTSEAGKTGRHEIVAHGKTVAQIYSTRGCEETDLSNAKLISAAPDLLNAAESLLQMIEDYEMEDELEAGEEGAGPVVLIRTAIAKARGQS